MLWTMSMVNRTIKLIDGAAFVIAAVLAWRYAYLIDARIELPQALLLSAAAMAFYWGITEARRVYSWERYRSITAQVGDAIVGLIGGAAVLWVFFVVFLPDQRPGLWPIAWAACVLVLLTTGRAIVALTLDRADTAGLFRRRVAVVGGGEEAADVVRNLTTGRQHGVYEIVGVYEEADAPGAADADVAGIPVTRGLDRLETTARERELHVIVLALPWEQRERIGRLTERLTRFAADVLMPVDKGWVKDGRPRLASIGGWPFVQLLRRPLRGSDQIVKTIEDYVVATVALTLAAPVMLLIAIAVRLESPGPILFRQTRLGFNGRTFTMYKFRTMHVDPADDGSIGTRRDDPRITRLGAILRRTSLDELPQLVNVLQGEMSIVGPRAHVPNMRVADRTYFETVHEYATRHRVKPGITGWAQINGMRGGITDEVKARRGVELDLFYIDNWSLWLDLQIMLRTAFAGMSGRDVF